MEEASQLGFTFSQSPFTNDNRFVLTTDGECWPTFVSGARIYFGDMDEVASFLHGVQWARDYYVNHLKLFTQKRLERKEQDVRNQYLVSQLRHEEKEDD
jgi:hypothetical protein